MVDHKKNGATHTVTVNMLRGNITVAAFKAVGAANQTWARSTIHNTQLFSCSIPKRLFSWKQYSPSVGLADTHR